MRQETPTFQFRDRKLKIRKYEELFIAYSDERLYLLLILTASLMYFLFNPFTPKFKKYNLPTFYREMYK